jgi:lipoprotein-anchoring transpeptidase ErfK/SrfK
MEKSSPWTMRSPWPYGSPYWYAPSTVQYVLWFHEGGYGIHDAWWRSQYGPGTNVEGPIPGTHGCVNVPYNDVVWIYNWADVGTPVTVG